jgi:parallel beta-helix repeat protein
MIRLVLVAALSCACTPASPPAVGAATTEPEVSGSMRAGTTVEGGTIVAQGRVGSSEVSPIGGTTLLVAPGGRAGARGTAEDPFPTITAAARAAGPGDVVRVEAGHYLGRVEIAANGTRERPIHFLPAGSGTVTIDGAGMPADTDLVRISGDYVEFRGFRVVNATRSGISLWGARHVAVRDNEVSGSYRFGIVSGHEDLGESSHVLVEGNTLFDNVRENVARDSSEGWARAIAMDATDDAVVRGNTVYGNYGEGIGLLSSRRGLIERNVVYDNFSVNVYLDNAPEALVEGNFIFTTGDARFLRDGRPAYGVVIANEWAEHLMPSRGITVRDNTLVGVGRPFYSDYGANSGLFDSDIDDNAVHGSLADVPHLVETLPQGRPLRVDGRTRG